MYGPAVVRRPQATAMTLPAAPQQTSQVPLGQCRRAVIGAHGAQPLRSSPLPIQTASRAQVPSATGGYASFPRGAPTSPLVSGVIPAMAGGAPSPTHGVSITAMPGGAPSPTNGVSITAMPGGVTKMYSDVPTRSLEPSTVLMPGITKMYSDVPTKSLEPSTAAMPGVTKMYPDVPTRILETSIAAMPGVTKMYSDGYSPVGVTHAQQRSSPIITAASRGNAPAAAFPPAHVAEQSSRGSTIASPQTTDAGNWSTDSSFSMGPDIPHDGIQQLDQFTSVSKAVAALNAGTVQCSSGLCIVYSNSLRCYVMLSRSDKKEEAARLSTQAPKIDAGHADVSVPPADQDAEQNQDTEIIAQGAFLFQQAAAGQYDANFFQNVAGQEHLYFGQNIGEPELAPSLDVAPPIAPASVNDAVPAVEPVAYPSAAAPTLPRSLAPASDPSPNSPGPALDPVGNFDEEATPCEHNENVPSSASSRPKPRDDVKCFMQERADGSKCVVVERAADGKRWRFEQSSIDFELGCDAESLSAWLGGISNQQMPGLLTLLGSEVGERGGGLKDAERNRDALRGSEDYDFFGLDGNECSDKDIERAYRKKSTQLHPDKGGDEKAFSDMRDKYDQIKSLRGVDKRKEGGGAIRWDPNDRESMLRAHGDLREQLVWITKHKAEVDKQVEELERRQKIFRTLTQGEQGELPRADNAQEAPVETCMPSNLQSVASNVTTSYHAETGLGGS